MEIHLIRHSPVNLASGICYGQSDVDLKTDYLSIFQSIELDTDYDSIFSSPLQRCTLMADFFQPYYKTDDRLMEMNFGDWELKKWDEIPKDEIHPWYQNFIETPAKNGESLLDLKKRVDEFIDEISVQNTDDKILIFTHAGVIRLFIQRVLNLDLNEIFKIKIEHNKRTILKFNPDELLNINL